MHAQGNTVARGYKLPRCTTCYLSLGGCICPLTPTLHTPVQWWILMHPDEWHKPTNTARLIGATLPHTRFFPWHRTAPPAALMALLRDTRFMPYLLCPHGDPGLFEGLRGRPWLPDRIPAFVLVDGTWTQARKILNRSPYLQGIPRMAIQPQRPSAYTLRRQRCTTHLSTVEVAIALLEQSAETTASSALQAYFQLFVTNSMAARHGHRPTRPPPELLQRLAGNDTPGHHTPVGGNPYGMAHHPG